MSTVNTETLEYLIQLETEGCGFVYLTAITPVTEHIFGSSLKNKWGPDLYVNVRKSLISAFVKYDPVQHMSDLKYLQWQVEQLYTGNQVITWSSQKK